VKPIEGGAAPETTAGRATSNSFGRPAGHGALGEIVEQAGFQPVPNAPSAWTRPQGPRPGQFSRDLLA